MTTQTDSEVSVLLVDDNPDDVSIIRRLLTQYTHTHFKVRATSTLGSCLEQLEDEGTDLLMLDYSLPAEDGISFLRRANSLMSLPPVIIVTGQNDYRLAAEAIRSGASDCIYKHSMTSQTLGQSLQEALAKSHNELALARFDNNIITALVETASRVDPTTGGTRLARRAEALGRGLELSEHEIDVLRYGALLHDIGKLGVRNELICRPGSLTEAELAEVQLHPLIGERICAPLRLSRELRPIIRHHHERWDGTGYVDGLAREDIPFLARVISVVDAFDAMTSDRPYRAAAPYSAAVETLRAGAGSQWDPDIVAVFTKQVCRGLHGPP
ncbi:MAG TPA: HD domain-containing phosphohydrolase [Dehalococcoidia bacterium]|nr:HD domain-containing phosphohydrolase [Dehalococcoidia bacterium]